MNQHQFELIENRTLGPATVLHVYRGPEVASHARAGQFVNLRVGPGSDPLLRRPISICSAEPAEGTFSLLIKVIGPGTRLLGELKPGTSVDMLAPLGKCFEWKGAQNLLLVAGGVGVAPMLMLAQEVRREAPAPQPRITFCYGARTASDFVLTDQIAQMADELILVTEDGSAGERGLVTEFAEKQFAPGCSICTCGPNPMMNDLLRRMRAAGLEGQVSLENQMGCGIGACQGCVVPTRSGYIRICCDGPVLPTQMLETIGV